MYLSDGDGKAVTRYFEHGCLNGFMTSINDGVSDETRTSIPYKIFTSGDVQRRAAILESRTLSIRRKRSEKSGNLLFHFSNLKNKDYI